MRSAQPLPIRQPTVHHHLPELHIEFKPLVQVDPAVLSASRNPLKNPHPGDYMLNKTSSTEGIASKKSLELKKRYLLGEPTPVATVGLMKSDSTSVLDSKFKNFHSTIQAGQKMLSVSPQTGASSGTSTASGGALMHSATTDMSPVMQSFIRHSPNHTAKSSALPIVPNSLASNPLSKVPAVELIAAIPPVKRSSQSDEKENVNRENNRAESDPAQTTASPIAATVVKAAEPCLDLPEIRPAEMFALKTPAQSKPQSPAAAIQTIDLCTPPQDSSRPSELRRLNLADEIRKNEEFIRKLDRTSSASETIDLTQEDEDELVSPGTPSAAERNKVTIDTMLNSRPTEPKPKSTNSTSEMKRDRRREHADSLSSSASSPSSSSSSVEDIPHYVLDSATSPDTNVTPPRSACQPTSAPVDDEALMQIDSLMIIDGKYVGDPEDLKLMQLPAGLKLTNTVKAALMPRTVPEVRPALIEPPPLNIRTPFKLSTSASMSTATPAVSTNKSVLKPYRSESASSIRGILTSQRSDLKFDARNENKLDTLRSMPISSDPVPLKPLQLNLKPPVAECVDLDKTPTAPDPPATDAGRNSDSDNEDMTNAGLTETELSDWAADDAVSENFVDMEFVLNSNKGTIRRNKKKKSSSSSASKSQSEDNKAKTPVGQPPVVATAVARCPLAKDLELDEIEFMDTGSEDSCMETYSATNQAMLRNRGYVQFVHADNGGATGSASAAISDAVRAPGRETAAESMARQQEVYSYKSDAGYGSSPKDSLDRNVSVENGERPERLGIDYIEQGACILGNDIDQRTPMNETAPSIFGVRKTATEQPDSLLDIDDDSLAMVPSTQTVATTEDSDALTVVTSPVESSVPLQTGQQPQQRTDSDPSTTSTTTASPPGAERNDDPTSASTTNRSSSLRSSTQRVSSLDDAQRPEDCSYEDYVRKLQMKISQISNARDSIDIRKTKRRHSKGDPCLTTTVPTPEAFAQQSSAQPATIASNGTVQNQSPAAVASDANSDIASQTVIDKPLSIFVHKALDGAEVPPASRVMLPTVTLNERIDEISKERAKQKDLIHDLVMDKLQSKKQQNAEKRLNRSRNRSSMFGGQPTAASTGSSPYASTHQPPAYDISPKAPATPVDPMNAPPKQSPAKLRDHSAANAPKTPRPASEYYAQSSAMPNGPLNPLAKTQSFSYYAPGSASTAIVHESPLKFVEFQLKGSAFSTPVPPPRRNRPDQEPAMTEKMRQDARARARLKSNQDLGISPDEKLQLLRKRLQMDASKPGAVSALAVSIGGLPNNKSDDLKLRERKMMSSKSVNDISSALASTQLKAESSLARAAVAASSDPMRSRTSSVSQPSKSEANVCESTAPAAVLKRRTQRAKDPERRKSIISYVSDLFHKKKSDGSDATKAAGQTQQSAEANGGASSSGGMFGRFRISPKSKSKDEQLNERARSEDLLHSGTSKDGYDRADGASNSLAGRSTNINRRDSRSCHEDMNNVPPPIPPLPVNYQRSDDESFSANESREQKKQRIQSKVNRQAELKRLRIAQEIQREQEEIEVKLKDLEARGVIIEKSLRGEGQNLDDSEVQTSIGANDDRMVKELLEIWRNITQLKKRDEELSIRQQELQLEHRHAQLKDQLNTRLSCSRLDKSSSDVAAEGAILNEMLEIVAKRAALRSFDANASQNSSRSSGSGAAVQPFESDI